jgi:hypothetical protein
MIDPLDKDIEAQRSAGNHHYQHTLEILRDRLQALESQATRDHSFRGIAWLIECSFQGGKPDYYCGPAEWCSNPYHAHKFKTREEAEAVSAEMATLGDRRVADHSWE